MPRFRSLAYLILAHVMAFPAMAAEPKLEKEYVLKENSDPVSWYSFDPSGKHLVLIKDVLIKELQPAFIVWDLADGKEICRRKLKLPIRWRNTQIDTHAVFHPLTEHLCFRCVGDGVSLKGIPLRDGLDLLEWKDVPKIGGRNFVLLSALLHINKERILQVSLSRTILTGSILYFDQSPLDQFKFTEAFQIKLKHNPSSLEMSPDGKTIAYTNLQEREFGQEPPPPVVELLDVKSKNSSTLTSKVPIETVISLRFSPDGKKLSVGGGDGLLRQWNVENQTENYAVQVTNFTLRTLNYSKNEKLLACTTTDSKQDNLYLIEAKSGKTVYSKKIPWIRNAIFSPDSNKLAVLHHKGIQIYDLSEWSKGLK
jgi:WD40 repeat protein